MLFEQRKKEEQKKERTNDTKKIMCSNRIFFENRNELEVNPVFYM